MAKATLNSALAGLRGKMGNVVYRQLYGRTVISCGPDFSRWKLTAPQKAHLRRFGAAARLVKFALKDPQRRAAYAAQARRQKRPLIAVAISDCYRQGL